jgi:hypothetical protein
MDALFARGRVVAVKTAGMADVACFLLGNRLILRQREIDLSYDLFGIFERESVAFRPADRLGVREGRSSIIRAVDIVPRPHGALSEVRPHHTGVELFHFLGMTRGFTARRSGDGGVITEG